jgi:hypothetical protein
MVTISKDDDLVTLINVFTVALRGPAAFGGCAG